MSGGLAYRPEIDGLRCLAVVPVILFHAGLVAIPGGFLGVDVFFVISGYLITSILLAEQAAGQFSIAGFYERRARRILPALFVVLAASIAPALFWLPPEQLKNFGQGLISVCLFVSNILLWFSSDYFDPSSDDNPLLHTWSLGVEEQYYVFFPLLVALIWPLGRRRSLWLLGPLAMLSLIASEWASHTHATANFYLIVSRAWELLAGSLLAYAAGNNGALQRIGQRSASILSAFGLLLIVGSYFWLDKSTRVPGVMALLPVGGAVCIIAFAIPGTLVSRILSSPPFVAIGKISFSAYLWHQPLLAFARMANVDSPGLLSKIVLVVLTFVLAWLSWRFVEQPFRNRHFFTRTQVFRYAAAGSGIFILSGTLLIGLRGLPQRYSADQLAVLQYNYDFASSYQYGLCFMNPKIYLDPKFTECTAAASGGEKLWLWGDSHAAQLYPGVQKTFAGRYRVTHVSLGGCPPDVVLTEPPSCAQFNARVMAELALQHPRRVILAARWYEHGWPHLMQTVAALRAAGVTQIDVVGPVPEWQGSLPRVLSHFDQPFYEVPMRTNQGLVAGIDTLDTNLQTDARALNLDYFSPRDVLCDKQGCLTRLGSSLESMTAWDYGHLTAQASEYLVSRMK